MSLKSHVVAGLWSTALLAGLAGVSFAAADALKPAGAAKPAAAKPADAVKPAGTAKIAEALRQAFPQVQQIDSLTPTEITGLYEVVSGQNVFYYYPEKELIVAGDIIGKDLKSRTAERREALRAVASAEAVKAVKSLPLDKAVKVGDGKHVVIEFTDPDCPYCRKAAEYFTHRSDLTQYVFFAPIAHPGAITKVQYILDAENKAQAYDAMMLGQEIPATAKPASEAAKALAQEHLALARKVGIQGTPTFFVNGEQVVGADIKRLEELLK